MPTMVTAMHIIMIPKIGAIAEKKRGWLTKR
jgi:hypothetical protein